MMSRHSTPLIALALLAPLAFAQPPSPTVAAQIKTTGPRTVLRHVRIIDGTKAPATLDQDIFLVDGRIANIAPAGTVACNDCGQEFAPRLYLPAGFDSAKLLESVKGRYGQY